MKVMIKMKYLFAFLVCMFVFPLASNAQCDYERQAELSRIASNVGFSYSYNINNVNVPVFTVNITNITDDIYVEDQQGNIISSDSERSYTYGQNLPFYVYSKDISCYGDKLVTQYITLPNYNFFSQSEECVKYPSFKYCQVWQNTTVLTNELFNSELEKYKKQADASNIEENEMNLFEKWLASNAKMLIVTVTIIIGFVILAIVRRRKK